MEVQGEGRGWWLEPVHRGEGGEKGLIIGLFLKVEPAGFDDGLDIRSVRKGIG